VSNGSSVEELWNNFKNIVHESVECFVPHKILRKNSNPEYYNKDIKRLKAKVRKAYNRRKLGVQYMEKLTSIQAATCGQERGTRGNPKIYIKG
jgi:hypothetical protein